MSLFYKKRGEHGLFMTIVIILFVIILVGILWIVVNGVIKNTKEQMLFDKFTLDLKIEQVKIINESALNISIKRNSGEGDLIGLNFIIYDGKNSEVFKQNTSIKELNKEDFIVNLLFLNSIEIKQVKVSPVFISESGKEIAGQIQDVYEIN